MSPAEVVCLVGTPEHAHRRWESEWAEHVLVFMLARCSLWWKAKARASLCGELACSLQAFEVTSRWGLAKSELVGSSALRKFSALLWRDLGWSSCPGRSDEARLPRAWAQGRVRCSWETFPVRLLQSRAGSCDGWKELSCRVLRESEEEYVPSRRRWSASSGRRNFS